MRLVLASGSPRRRELLAALGFRLDVRPADVDESVRDGEDPREYALRVAAEKAAVVAPAFPADAVLAADTVVVLDGAVLGKPRDDDDARRMLRALSGRPHQVTSAVCVRRGDREWTDVVSSGVHFDRLDDARIDWYVATGEPRDKAGGYAVQGLGGAFVLRVDGSVSGVVGLPVAETLALLRRAGVPMPWERA